jgi:hypothetical protein
MPWSKKKYPEVLQPYPVLFKRKALEIASSLMASGLEPNEPDALQEAIRRATDWAVSQGLDFVAHNHEAQIQSSEIFTVKAVDGGWQIFDSKQEARSLVIRGKAIAISTGRNLAKMKKARLHVLSIEGTVLFEVSYGPKRHPNE